MKRSFLLLLVVATLAGCATSSIESRRHERMTSYASLSADLKSAVDSGQIRRGMTPDAVYIAWGNPSQILQQEDERGPVTTWLYHGSYLEETRYWPYRARVPNYDYNIRGYVSAEVIFQNGVVTHWRTLPKPPE